MQTTLFSAQDLRGGGRQGGAQYQYAMITPGHQRTAPLGARAGGQAEGDAGHRRRHLRPGSRRTAGERGDRPRRRRAARRQYHGDRQRAEQCLFATADLDDLRRSAISTRWCWRSIRSCRPIRRCSTASMSARRAASRCRSPRWRISSAARRRWRCAIRASSPPPRSASTWHPAWRSATPRRRCENAARELRMPEDVRTEFAGNARFLQQSLATQPLLIAAALISIYIVLGVLYESLLHPLTIISTLPSAGLGALLALLITGTDLSIMGHDRHHPADGHREEERHHAGGFRAGGGTPAGAVAGAGDPRGVPGAVPSDHDDDAGRAARRCAAGARIRHRRRTAAAAGHLDHRRADRVADADALHDAGGVPCAGAAGGKAAADRGAGE